MSIDGSSPEITSLAQRGSTPTDATQEGLLIVNADDWGRDKEVTDRTLDCILCGAVSSVSAMVFMEDSERAAVMARERKIDCGLHLNLTSSFTGAGVSSQLAEHQGRLSTFLRRNRLAQVLFHPGLSKSFEYVVATQIDEFRRIYGEEPGRLDGHHHMHLCSNVLFCKLIPAGTVVRRNFTFRHREKGLINRKYRQFVDAVLSRRHVLTDYFFALPPLEPPDRLREIFALARHAVVEVETHPVNPQEYSFLTGGEIFRLAGGTRIARRYVPLPDRSRRGPAKTPSNLNSVSAGNSTRTFCLDAEHRGTSSELAQSL